MPTLREMIYDVKNIAYGGEQSDDNRVSDHQVAYWIMQQRAVLVRNELANRNKIPTSFIQYLEQVRLAEVDINDQFNDNTAGITVYKSEQRIPETIQRNGKNTIIAVEAEDHSESYSETTFFRRKYNAFNKYSSASGRWWLQDGYLYLTATALTKPGVIISGVFENPEEAANFYIPSGEPAFDWDSKYPVSNSMADTITNIILKNKLGITRQMPVDDSNNSDEQQANEPS